MLNGLGPVVQLVKTSPSHSDENGEDPRFEPGRAHQDSPHVG